MPYQLPALPYAYDALEPHIDEATMRLHHDKHHQAYVDNLNKAVADTEWDGRPLEQLLDNLDLLPEDRRIAAAITAAATRTTRSSGRSWRPVAEALRRAS